MKLYSTYEHLKSHRFDVQKFSEGWLDWSKFFYTPQEMFELKRECMDLFKKKTMIHSCHDFPSMFDDAGYWLYNIREI